MLAVLGILIPSATFPAWKKFSRELSASSSVTIPENQASLACWVSSAREVSPVNRSNYKSTRERVGSKGLCGRWRLHLMGSWCPGLLITLWGSWVSTTQLFFFKASHKPNDIGLSKYVSLSHSRTRRSHKMNLITSLRELIFLNVPFSTYYSNMGQPSSGDSSYYMPSIL